MAVIWTTREGLTLVSTHMSTEHIKNCIKLLDRKFATEDLTRLQMSKNRALVHGFKYELDKRNEFKCNLTLKFNRFISREIDKMDKGWM